MWQGADALTSRADRVGTDDNQNADGCARGGSKNTHRDTDSISESDFCIIVVQNEDNDVFSLLQADLDIQEKEGKPVADQLAKVARSALMRIERASFQALLIFRSFRQLKPFLEQMAMACIL